jgi:hypothetical protein
MKFLAKDLFPSREEIRKRMDNKIGVSAFSPITTACAEECERIMHDVWLANAKRGDGVSIKSGDKFHYTCPCCKKPIYRTAKYCSSCGNKINWF